MDRKLETPFAKPLADAVRLFEHLGIGYALVGGVAAMFYGRPRITEDVDFVAGSGHQELLAASPGTMKAHGFDPSCTWKLYHEGGIEIDLWKDEFVDGIVSRAIAVPLGTTLMVRLAEMHDLVAMKLRAGRFQDDYDISEIVRHNQIDPGVLRQRVTGEQLIRFEQIVARVRAESSPG